MEIFPVMPGDGKSGLGSETIFLQTKKPLTKAAAFFEKVLDLPLNCNDTV
jgi:hypothetical protein